MPRFLPLLLLTVAAVAAAAPFVDLPVADAVGAKGLNLVVLRADDACDPATDGWYTDATASWVAAHDATVVQAPRTREHLDLVVGEDGFRGAVLNTAWKDGRKVDTACGCLSGEALVSWLDGVTQGRTAADTIRAGIATSEARELPTDRWFALAEADYCAGRYDASFATLRKLWEILPERAPEQRELRLTRVSADMGAIAMRHPPAREQLVEMRAALDAEKDQTTTALDEWVVLNRILGDDAATLAWWDEARSDRSRGELVEHQAPNLFVLLTEADRWADAGEVIGDVDAWLDRWKKAPNGREWATSGYVSLLAAGRTGDAARLAKGMLKVLPADTACALVSRSTELGVTHRSEKKVASACADAAVVDAWSASL